MDAPHQHPTFEALRDTVKEMRARLLANHMAYAQQVDGLHKAVESMAAEVSAEREADEARAGALDDRLMAFTAYLQDRQDEAGEGQLRVETLSERNAELERKLAEVEDRLAARQQQYNDEAAAAEAAHERVAHLEKELAELRTDADSRVEALQQTLRERNDEHDRALADAESARAECDAIRQKLDTLEADGSAAADEAEALRAARDQAAEALQAQQEAQEQLRRELETAREERAALDEKVASLEQSLEERAADAGLEEELSAARRELEARTGALAEAEQAARDAEARAEALATDRDQAQAALEEQRVRADLLDQKLRDENARGTKSALAEQLAEALRDADQLRDELRTLRAGQERPGPVTAPAPTSAVAAPAAWPQDPLARIRVAARHLDGSHRRTLGAILVDADVVTQEQVEEALEEQRLNPQTHLGAILVERGHASEEAVGLALACQSQVDFVALGDDTVDPNAPTLVNERLAQKHHCIPIQASPDTIVVAMANPLDLVAIEDVERASNRKAEVVVATRSDIASALERYYWEPE